MVKILDCIWLTTMFGTIGIVVTEDCKSKERNAYICPVPGNSEATDRIHTIDYGAPLPLALVDRIKEALLKK